MTTLDGLLHLPQQIRCHPRSSPEDQLGRDQHSLIQASRNSRSRITQCQYINQDNLFQASTKPINKVWEPWCHRKMIAPLRLESIRLEIEATDSWAIIKRTRNRSVKVIATIRTYLRTTIKALQRIRSKLRSTRRRRRTNCSRTANKRSRNRCRNSRYGRSTNMTDNPTRKQVGRESELEVRGQRVTQRSCRRSKSFGHMRDIDLNVE